MLPIDYQQHNDEVRQFLDQYDRGINPRIRMSISCNPRIILLNPALNQKGITYEQYFSDPATMLDVQMQFTEYLACDIAYDHIMGMEESAFGVYPDFQNILEPCWLGAPIFYPESNDPSARHFLTDQNKRDYLKKPINPFDGIMQTLMEYYQYFIDQQKSGYTYKGKPLAYVGTMGIGTDGPFTNACSLWGATDACLDLYEDPVYMQELLAFITESTIRRIQALREFYNFPKKSPNLIIADDSIALLSCEDYERFVLPFHKQLFDELTTGEQKNGIHLCGDAVRHFPLIAKELNVDYFDTGFPVNHGDLVQQMGLDVTIAGGVHVDTLLTGTAEEITAQTRRILEEVKPHSRRFIMKEANNLSPRTSPDNILTMYNAVKKYGQF